jgi:hypothetical protein
MLTARRSRRLRPAVLLLAQAIAAAGAPAWAQVPATAGADCPPALRLVEPHARFGDLYQREVVEHRFTFVNVGARPLALGERVAVSGNGTMEAAPDPLPPGAEGTLNVRQPLGDRLGRTSFRYALVTDDPCVERYRFSLSGFVQSAYEPEKGALDLGWVDRAGGAEAALELFSREIDRLEVMTIEEAPAGLAIDVAGRAGVAGEGVRISATLAPGAPMGRFSGRVRLRTNVPHQPLYELTVTGNVFEDLVPAANPVDLGLVRVGEELAGEVVLRSRSGAPAALAEVASDRDSVAATVMPCAPAAADCVRLRLAHQATEEGVVEGTVRVVPAGGGAALPIAYRGWVVAAGTEIRRLVLDDPGAGPEAGDSEPNAGQSPPAAPSGPLGGSGR